MNSTGEMGAYYNNKYARAGHGRQIFVNGCVCLMFYSAIKHRIWSIGKYYYIIRIIYTLVNERTRHEDNMTIMCLYAYAFVFNHNIIKQYRPKTIIYMFKVINRTGTLYNTPQNYIYFILNATNDRIIGLYTRIIHDYIIVFIIIYIVMGQMRMIIIFYDLNSKLKSVRVFLNIVHTIL